MRDRLELAIAESAVADTPAFAEDLLRAALESDPEADAEAVPGTPVGRPVRVVDP